MTFVDRYHQYGLVRNPFSTQALAEHRVFVDRGVPAPRPHSGTLVQLLGDKGFGKSTHIAHWRALMAGPYHYVPLEPYGSRWARPPFAPSGIAYGDEIDRMPLPLRRRWFRSLARTGATLVIGTHVDLAPLGRNAGFDVVTHHLQPLLRCELGEFLALRLESAALAGATYVDFTNTDMDYIFDISGGIPREVEDVSHRLLAERVAAAVT